MTKKTQMQYDKILAYMKADEEYSIQDFCQLLNLRKKKHGMQSIAIPEACLNNREYKACKEKAQFDITVRE